ncbi:CHAP domain-containing protein [uncultured Ellagibacter sp.]|uniref:CHAP domain-containing protein n=1 Tax=uncultured Ellagibacter sp. TaxID=2137580 RepID=UPI002628F8D3|nr:CHAP domain-containing protein [uncultured Ellagibacter sp.]
MPTANDVLYCAQQWIGYSRWTDPEEGTVFGRWYAKKVGDSYFGTSGVPYCAMFTSYCLDWAGVSAAGIPGAYVPWILSANADAGRLVRNEDAEPGDLVMFDWQGDGVADHIGIVEENHPDGSWMQTIEGNTSPGNGGSQSNGGGVYRRARSYGSIIGVVRPYYETEEEEDMLTEHQDKLLATIYEQVTGTYDPTGRGVELCDHDHIKWIGKQCADNADYIKAVDAKLDKLIEKLG